MRFNFANGLVVPRRECWSVVTKESARFDNNDSEPKSQVRELFQRKLNFFKDTCCQKHFVILPMSEGERMFPAKRQLQTTKWKNKKIKCKTTGGVPG